jgi:hypothetical protein
VIVLGEVELRSREHLGGDRGVPDPAQRRVVRRLARLSLVA